MAVEGEFPKIDGDILYGSEANGLVPVGAVISWLKSYTNTPALSGQFVECSGQTLSNADSVYDGQTIPDLNGGDRFLRGGATSGSTGGAATADLAHTHTGPSHDHSFSDGFTTSTDGDHQHSVDGGTAGPTTTTEVESGTGTTVASQGHTHTLFGANTSTQGDHSHTGTASGDTGNSGTGATGTALSSSQSILPPYYEVVWIMRII